MNYHRIGAIVVVVVAAGIHLTSASWHVLFGEQNADEGFYAVATRSVAEGEMPYRDFGFTQPPLILYANALPLRVIGFGLFEQRSVNGIWGLAALTLAAVWLAKRTTIWMGAMLALVFSLSAPWMYFIHLGKTYAITSLLGVVAALTFLRMQDLHKRAALLGLFAILGAGSRLPAAPFFGLLWLLALFPACRFERRTLIFGLLGGVLGVAPFLPFWVSAPESTRFWIFDFHRLSIANKEWRLAWQEIVSLNPSVWLLCLGAVYAMLTRKHWTRPETGVLFAATTALGFNLLPKGAYEEYGVPFLLPLAMASAAMVHDAVREYPVWRKRMILLVLVAAQILTAPILYRHTLPARKDLASWWLPLSVPAYNTQVPAQLGGARQAILDHLPPGAMFIGPNLILAAETGHAVPAELRMGSFGITSEMPEDEARRLHLATPETLKDWITNPQTTAVGLFKRPVLNYSWSVPKFTSPPNATRARIDAYLRSNFHVGSVDGESIVIVRQASAVGR